MSNQIQTILNADQEAIKSQVAEIENTSRIVGNLQSLITDMEVKGAYAKVVYECMMFLESFHKGLQGQVALLKASLPNATVSEKPSEKAGENAGANVIAPEVIQ